MVFVKIQKNKAYFKRYQVKFRRRRQGKTNYHLRQRLVTQDKTKFNAPRYRLVVRITNKDVICQIISAKIVGDKVFSAAYSHELPKYGVKVGLTNYSACYCTGLLLARRVLKKIGLDKLYEGVTEVDGEHFIVEEPEEEGKQRPFKAYPDFGLSRVTTGAKIFGVVKGAADGGLYIPHSNKRFPGYDEEEKVYEPSEHRDRIFGQHVAEYQKLLIKKDKENGTKEYEKKFSQYVKNKIKPEDIEEMYEKAHELIRKDPVYVKKPAKEGVKRTVKRKTKLPLADRKKRVEVKKARYIKLAEQEEEEEDEVEEEEDEEMDE